MPDGAVLLADRWYPTKDPGSRPTVLIRTPYGRRTMGPLGRLYAERGYQTVIQSCRATFGSEGEWEPLRHEQADGHATLEWVASQPWFDGRLVMWGGSYLGVTQWAVAEDAPGLPQGPRPAGDRVELPRRHHLPGRVVRPRDGGGVAATSSSTRSWAGARCCARPSPAASWWRGPATSCRSAGATRAAIGEPAPLYQDWLEHSAPGDPWWDPWTSGGASRRCRRPASSPGGTTSSCRPRWTTTRRCAAPAARRA